MSPEEKTEMRDVLRMLLNLSEGQFDPSAAEALLGLLSSERSDEEMRDGLKRILDDCAHGALASDFVMRILDIAWRGYGGSL